MKFLSNRDYETIVRINKELVNDVVDTGVYFYKLNGAATQTNSYNESPKKNWYSPVFINCLFERQEQKITSDMQGLDMQQSVKFLFLREELKAHEVYPEEGDIVLFDSQFYEINNTNENQLWGGQPSYRHSIVCEAHLSRNSNLQLERPNIYDDAED